MTANEYMNLTVAQKFEYKEATDGNELIALSDELQVVGKSLKAASKNMNTPTWEDDWKMSKKMFAESTELHTYAMTKMGRW